MEGYKSFLKNNVNEGTSFDYQMLGRLIADVDYYYGAGNKSDKNLWAGNPKDHADEIEKIYKKLNPKPEWISKKFVLDMVKKLREEK
jgi:hypothetical protein